VAGAVVPRGAEWSAPAPGPVGLEHAFVGVCIACACLGEIVDREADGGRRVVWDDDEVGDEVGSGGAELRRAWEVGGRIEGLPGHDSRAGRCARRLLRPRSRCIMPE